MSEKPRLGFIGIGLMGKPMTLRLLAAGYPVAVWNRSRDKLAAVTAKGAVAMATPGELARAADIVMLCVTDQESVAEILFGAGGLAEGAAKGSIVVDFSSIAPQAARDCAGRLGRLGVGYIDAPVSGGTVGAEQGTLAVMAGGAAAHVEFVRPLIAELASRFTHMGDAGAGQVAKLANQVIVGSLIPIIAEALRLAEAGGVDPARLPLALQGGFADSKPLQVFGPRMAARAYEPALFTADVMLKDLNNALALAAQAGIALPVASAAAERYRQFVAQGKGAVEPSAFIDLPVASSPQ